jgi:secreted PhoX family phosphatase
MKRRQFLQLSAAAMGSFAVSDSFKSLSAATRADAQKLRDESYGPIKPVREEKTGLPLLQLPKGFRYLSFGWTGDELADGTVTPEAHDGMGVISQAGSLVTLIRNHEVDGRQACFSDGSYTYDKFAGGGCTSLVFDTASGTVKDSRTAIAGTLNNCAGGVTPWGTWLTCEESVGGIMKTSEGDTYSKDHGWVFEVPADGTAPAKPLKDMGRFVHEAVAIDPDTGIVYETEDRIKCGFFRFLPAIPGKLAEGGRLQMMRVPGHPDLTRSTGGAKVFEQIEWVDIKAPELAHTPGTEDTQGVFNQGARQDATAFGRLEGCWYGNDMIYFVSTCGGEAEKGQIWGYHPKNNSLHLIFESTHSSVLNFPDQIAVSPRGGMVLCEDCDPNKVVENGREEEYFPRLHGLTPEGKIFTLAMNNCVLEKNHRGFQGDFRGSEWAGATFSPDGQWLFVNLYSPGMTLAITGPWEKGGL